jgi:hypothetical protein
MGVKFYNGSTSMAFPLPLSSCLHWLPYVLVCEGDNIGDIVILWTMMIKKNKVSPVTAVEPYRVV